MELYPAGMVILAVFEDVPRLLTVPAFRAEDEKLLRPVCTPPKLLMLK